MCPRLRAKNGRSKLVETQYGNVARKVISPIRARVERVKYSFSHFVRRKSRVHGLDSIVNPPQKYSGYCISRDAERVE
jgi:hypothetical protein